MHAIDFDSQPDPDTFMPVSDESHPRVTGPPVQQEPSNDSGCKCIWCLSHIICLRALIFIALVVSLDFSQYSDDEYSDDEYSVSSYSGSSSEGEEHSVGYENVDRDTGTYDDGRSHSFEPEYTWDTAAFSTHDQNDHSVGQYADEFDADGENADYTSYLEYRGGYSY